MRCYWCNVREECKFDLVGEATRDGGRIAKGTKVYRGERSQGWIGKHRYDEEGQVVCFYGSKARSWQRGTVDPCTQCKRELGTVLTLEQWERYLAFRARTKSYGACRDGKFIPWFRLDKRPPRKVRAKGWLWTRKHWREGRAWVCGIATPSTRLQRLDWEREAARKGVPTCGTCGRPLGV